MSNPETELKKRAPEPKKKPSEFDPSSVAAWEKNQPVPFLFLALAFDMIDEEKGTIVIANILCNLLRTVIHATPEDLVPVVYLSANRIALGLKLGIGKDFIIKALAKACGCGAIEKSDIKNIKNQYKEKGDLGLVAKASRSRKSMMWFSTKLPDALTIRKVFNTFLCIAKNLYASFDEESGFLQFATSITSNDAEEIQKFLDKAVDASCEGLIIKTLDEDATYEPSKRSLNWLTLEKDYLENIGYSLDLVPIAGFHGRGKQTGLLRVRPDKAPEQATSSEQVAEMFNAQSLTITM